MTLSRPHRGTRASRAAALEGGNALSQLPSVNDASTRAYVRNGWEAAIGHLAHGV